VIRLSPAISVARAALLDLARRRDLAVAGIFMAAMLLLLAVARGIGIEDPATGTFLLNLGLSSAAGLAWIMVLLLAARQFPEELENRTLYPLLARPVHRAEVLAGKWIACALAGMGLYAAMTLPVLLLAPRLESYDNLTALQMVALQGPALMAIAAWSMAFSLLLPKGPALLVSGALVFAAGPLRRFGEDAFPLWLLPDVSRLDLVLRYTDGIGPLPALDVARLVVCALVWTLLGLSAGAWLFGRKKL